MALTLTLPDHFSWVILTAVGTGWLGLWQSSLVGKLRKAAKIQYPQAYAEKAEADASKIAMRFNCAQRAHQNTLEILPQTVLSLLVAGTKYPELATGLGVIWLAGRIIYTLGYITGEPKKRIRGSFSVLATVGLNAVATWTAGKLVLSTL